MKLFILTFMGIVVLFVFSACGLIYTTKEATKEQKELMEQYAGLYVFDKKLREETIQRDKERDEYEEYIESISSTKEELEKNRDKYNSYEKYPKILSNGYRYFNKSLFYTDWGYEGYDEEFEPYIQKIKEYMGEELFNELKPNIILTSYYQVDRTVVPLTFVVDFIVWTKTTYLPVAPFGDDAPFKLTEKEKELKLGYNIFYLENGKFVKSDEKRQRAVGRDEY